MLQRFDYSHCFETQILDQKVHWLLPFLGWLVGMLEGVGMQLVEERPSYHVGKLLAVLVLNFVIKLVKRGLVQAGKKELEQLSEGKPPLQVKEELLWVMALAELKRSQRLLELEPEVQVLFLSSFAFWPVRPF